MKNTKTQFLDLKIINTLNYIFAVSVLLYALAIYLAVNQYELIWKILAIKLCPAVFWYLFFSMMSTYYSWYQQEKIKLEQHSKLKSIYKRHKYQQQCLSFILVVIIILLIFLRSR
ncbi:hypothetical protein A3K93_04840 [Acinetobacter sp. NCu2D-2]|nr:hypothetical protein A3K93_04840 [Acinetobacter sp. NCu2D-2]